MKNVDEFFPKSSNALFCPQLNNIQFTVRDEQRNKNIFTFKKLKSEKLDIFLN